MKQAKTQHGRIKPTSRSSSLAGLETEPASFKRQASSFPPDLTLFTGLAVKQPVKTCLFPVAVHQVDPGMSCPHRVAITGPPSPQPRLLTSPPGFLTLWHNRKPFEEPRQRRNVVRIAYSEFNYVSANPMYHF